MSDYILGKVVCFEIGCALYILCTKCYICSEPSADPEYAFCLTASLPPADEHAVENSKRVIGELTQRMKKKVAPGKVNKNKRGE